jgi:hypothetical protein
MTCPHKTEGLRQLPGKKYDDSARVLRQQFLDDKVDLEKFVGDYANHFPRTSDERFAYQIRAYGLAAVVITNFWSYMKAQPIAELLVYMKEKFYGTSYDEQVSNFFLCCNAIIGQYQNKYIKDVRKEKDGVRSKDFDSFLCFAGVARQRRKKMGGVPFPSTKDLTAMVTRMAHVIPLVFERDMGRPPDKREIFALLRHPSVGRFFIDIMMNDRPSTHPFIHMLEGNIPHSLNESKGRFDPKYFELDRCEDVLFIRLRSDVVAEHRARFIRADKRRLKRKKPLKPVLGCPVLYTGLFKEKYDWMINLLEGWLP